MKHGQLAMSIPPGKNSNLMTRHMPTSQIIFNFSQPSIFIPMVENALVHPNFNSHLSANSNKVYQKITKSIRKRNLTLGSLAKFMVSRFLS